MWELFEEIKKAVPSGGIIILQYGSLQTAKKDKLSM